MKGNQTRKAYMKGNRYFKSSPHESLVWKNSGHLHLYSFQFRNCYSDQYNLSFVLLPTKNTSKPTLCIEQFISFDLNRLQKNRKFQYTKSRNCKYSYSLVLYRHPLTLNVSSFYFFPFCWSLEIISSILGNYIWSCPIWLIPSIAIWKESHNLSFLFKNFEVNTSGIRHDR